MTAEPSPLTIAHIVDYLMPTMGYQEFLLPKWNARHGHRVHIVTSDRYAPVPHYAQTWGPMLGPRVCGSGVSQVQGVTVHRLRCLFEVKSRPWLRGLGRTLRAIAPSALFIHGTASFNAFRAALLARKLGAGLVYDNHMTFGCRNTTALGRFGYALLRCGTRYLLTPVAHRFLGVARESSDFLAEGQGIPHERIADLPLGVDTDLFSFDPQGRARLRDAQSIPQDARVILQTGKLTSDKSPEVLADAAAPLMSQHADLHLVYLGGGDEAMLERLRKPVARAGAMDRLHVLPFVPAKELAAAYSHADVCVYPGAASLSALEAAACARAVIMTDLPASRWRAEQGVGLTYPTGNVQVLRSRLAGLLQDAARRRELGERAREAVLEAFSYDRIAREAEDCMAAAAAQVRTQGTGENA